MKFFLAMAREYVMLVAEGAVFLLVTGLCKVSDHRWQEYPGGRVCVVCARIEPIGMEMT